MLIILIRFNLSLANYAEMTTYCYNLPSQINYPKAKTDHKVGFCCY